MFRPSVSNLSLIHIYPLRKVAASAGDVKKQVGNTVKALNGQYKHESDHEYGL